MFTAHSADDATDDVAGYVADDAAGAVAGAVADDVTPPQASRSRRALPLWKTLLP